jgi:8-oxo-dGTP diphosphatase
VRGAPLTPLRVTAAIIRRDGRVLIARRKAGGHLGGYWEFPGGKIESGETPEECLARELEEEFSVGAKVGAFITSSRFAYEDCQVELLAYEAALGSEDWVLTSHDETRWVEIRELTSYKLAPADLPIAEVLAGST